MVILEPQLTWQKRFSTWCNMRIVILQHPWVPIQLAVFWNTSEQQLLWFCRVHRLICDHLRWCASLHPASIRGESKPSYAVIGSALGSFRLQSAAQYLLLTATAEHSPTEQNSSSLSQILLAGWLFVCECARQCMPDGLYGRRDVVISLHVCWTNLSIQFLLLVISAMRVALSSLCFSSGDKQFFRKKQR